MQLIRFILISLLVCAGWNPANAQEIGDYVQVRAPSDWIINNELPSFSSETYADRDDFYLLVDWQDKLDPNTEAEFFRYAKFLNTSSGVEDNGSIEISFDPSFEKIILHHVRIIRDGIEVDKTDLSKFDIYREETDRQRLLINGRLQISYFVPDLRTGDVLDYAYTRLGKNPALKGHFARSLQQAYDDIALKLNHRVLVHDSFPLFEKRYNEAKNPQRSISGRYRDLRWEMILREPFLMDDDRPQWDIGFPTYQLSSFENWAEVGRFFAPYYKVSDSEKLTLTEIAQSIEAEQETPQQRARAALQYVQSNIRYVGIEIGSGGFIPRPPDLVHERRYGDCKDMTLFLVELLNRLDISADPVLVNLDKTGGVANIHPNYSAFDHVVVRAEIDDQAYILDPTRGEQLGDLENLQQGFFRKGVLISDESPGMIDLTIPVPEYFEDFLEEFDLTDLSQPVKMKSVSTYYMYRADGMNDWHKSEGIAGTEKAFLEFYQNQYPTIRQIGDMEIVSDQDMGSISFTVNYEIPDAWEPVEEDGLQYFYGYASETDSNIPNFESVSRTRPFAIGHPVISRQILRFNVDDSWSFDTEETKHETDAFKFSKTESFDNNVYEEVYLYESKADHITADKFAETMKVLDEVDDNLGVTLQYALEGGGAASLWDEYNWIAIFALLFAGLIALVYAFSTVNKHETNIREQIFYPVNMKKFVIMSFLTFGIYQWYWIYRNWRWVLIVQEEKIWPFIRSIFLPFTNFSLFSRMSRESPTPFNWMGLSAGSLAGLYLVGTFAQQVVDNLENLLWLSILIFVILTSLLIPIAQFVLKLNSERPDLIEENSKWTWETFALILILLLLFITFIFIPE